MAENLNLFPKGRAREANVRETSVKSFHEGEATGLLSRRRRQVLAALLEQRVPVTARELLKKHPEIDGLWKRLSELERIGAVRECGKRECKITHRLAITWEATGGGD